MTNSPRSLVLLSLTIIAFFVFISLFVPKIEEKKEVSETISAEDYILSLDIRENSAQNIYQHKDNQIKYIKKLKENPSNRRLWKTLIREWVRHFKLKRQMEKVYEFVLKDHPEHKLNSLVGDREEQLLSETELLLFIDSAKKINKQRLLDWLNFYKNEETHKKSEQVLETKNKNWKILKDKAEKSLILESNQQALKYYSESYAQLRNVFTGKSLDIEDQNELDELVIAYSSLLIKEKKEEIFLDLMRDSKFSKSVTLKQNIKYHIYSNHLATVTSLRITQFLEHLKIYPFTISLLSAMAWLLFLLVFFTQYHSSKRKLLLIITAFIFSFIMTLFFSGFDAFRDYYFPALTHAKTDIDKAVYYFIGVALPEEFFKLLLFIPFAFIIPKKSTSLAFVAAAAIGLGFAANENIHYFSMIQNSGIVLARFLTANFFHIALTAIIASSFHEAIKIGGDKWSEFSQNLLLMIAFHGAYDFFLSSHFLNDGLGEYIAMGIFVYTSQLFFKQGFHSYKRRPAIFSLRHIFSICLSLTIGLAILYGSQLSDTFTAVDAMILELMSGALIAYMFFYEIEKA